MYYGNTRSGRRWAWALGLDRQESPGPARTKGPDPASGYSEGMLCLKTTQVRLGSGTEAGALGLGQAGHRALDRPGPWALGLSGTGALEPALGFLQSAGTSSLTLSLSHTSGTRAQAQTITIKDEGGDEGTRKKKKGKRKDEKGRIKHQGAMRKEK